jgi:glutamate synthase (NADPH/NADH) small chain
MPRAKVERQIMAEQPPLERIGNFKEVPFGYTLEQARAEASRCLICKKSECMKGCPVEVNIPGFLAKIEEGDLAGAIRIVKETNGLPAICGRVCPQETQCEAECLLGKKKRPVGIGNLERFVADYEREQLGYSIPEMAPKNGRKVAVVGSGPAGLTCAADLCRMGYGVSIFEAFHKPGGVLAYGIPEFRLPKEIVRQEVEYVKSLGAEVHYNHVIGKLDTIDELFEQGYSAVFVGTGAGLPSFLGLPGENAIGIYSANEYLTRTNLMKAFAFPNFDTPIIRGKRVAVLGGGNVAMDSARTALRLGALESNLVYRRSRQEMPARAEEAHHAEDEGVRFHYLTNPTRFHSDERGWVKGMDCIKMELGEPDASGRRRPIPLEGSEFFMAADVIVVAIGNGPNPLIPQTTPDIAVSKRGTIIADKFGRCSKKGVYAGGDIVLGAATVILAMGAGKTAAKTIDRDIRGIPDPVEEPPAEKTAD